MTNPTRQQLPQRIRLTILDRESVIPETADRAGPHFPRSVAIAMRLKQPVDPAVLTAALRKVDDRFPQFRLAYTLDSEHSCWQRVPDSELDEHLASLVRVETSDAELAELLSNLIITNNMPFSRPLGIVLRGNDIVFKINHVLGDAACLFPLIRAVVLAILDPDEFSALPDLPLNFGLPLWRVVTQSPGRAVQVFIRWFVILREWLGEWRTPACSTPSLSEKASKLAPMVSGSPMKVVLKTIPRETLKTLRKIKHVVSADGPVSLTTVLYVLLGKRLAELGFVGKEHWYTFPVDLRRYLKHPSAFVAGNLGGEQRVHVSEDGVRDLAHECAEVHRQLNRKVNALEPLATVPMLWLLALPGDRFYNRVTLRTKKGGNGVDLAHGVFIAVPLIGTLRIVISFAIVGEQGNWTLTYDPNMFSAAQIEDLLAMFDPDWLERHLQAAQSLNETQ
jgi:hypothetical protein